MHRFLTFGLVMAFVITPFTHVHAAYKGDVAGWIPWWTAEAGVESAREHIGEFDTIYPFVYEVNNDASLKNRVDFDDNNWDDLFDEARDKHVDIIPTILWTNAAEIDAVLSDKRQREDHIDAIVDMVEDNDFDGVDIDYEGKWPQTKDDFSRFLRDLKDELDDKELVCTVEAQTPAEDLYKNKSDAKDFEYSTDYEAIDRYCDRVQLMAYDQQRADLTLNEERKGLPYAPVADNKWVEKVLNVALKDIDADKLSLGIPTYGRAWDITVSPEWYRDYKSVAALNPPRIKELSEDIYDAPVGRSAGGEAVISYFPETSPFKVFNALGAPKGTPKGYERAAVALYISTLTKLDIPVRFVAWSDATAVQSKLDLADKYDLAGVSLFKIDNEEDPNIWDLF